MREWAPPATLHRLWARLRLTSGSLALMATVATTLAYVLAFIPVHSVLGGGFAATSVLPVALIGWFYGPRAGVAAGILAWPVNTTLLVLAGQGGWDVIVRAGGLSGSLAIVAIGGTIGWLSTAIRRAERREALATTLAEQTREAVRVRDDLLAAASHDLQTPAASIRLAAQRVRRRLARQGAEALSPLDDEMAQIEGTAARLEGLVQDLVDVAMLQVGQQQVLAAEPMDLVALVRRVVAEHALLREEVEVQAELPDSPLVGHWDPGRVARVVSNLLSNAVKYSPADGSVCVRVRRDAVDGTPWAELVVEDRGLGIPAEDLPYVFERFRRGRNAVGRFTGAGIGLATARNIVEQHGGTITVESKEGEGSTFRVRLPL